MAHVLKILILQLKRIGDAILSAPVIHSIKKAKPEAEITLMVSGATAGIANALGADKVVVLEEGTPKGKFDVCLDLSGTDRSAWRSFRSGAKKRVCYQRHVKTLLRKIAWNTRVDASVRDLHTIDYHLKILEPLGIEGDPTVALDLPSEVTEKLPDIMQGNALKRNQFLIVHPGSARSEKHWIPDRWAEVMDAIAKKHRIPCVITGSNDEEEQEHIAAIKSSLSFDHPDLSGKLSLLELAGLISRAQAAVGVDTAAMHLAGAFERPAVTLFGPTNPFHWRARHADSTVVLASANAAVADFVPRHEKSEMSAIEVPVVQEAVDLALSQQSGA